MYFMNTLIATMIETHYAAKAPKLMRLVLPELRRFVAFVEFPPSAKSAAKAAELMRLVLPELRRFVAFVKFPPSAKSS